MSITGIGIGRACSPHHGTIRGILRYGAPAQTDVRRNLVDAGQIDREGLVIGQSSRIRHPHGDVVAGGTLVVQ